MWSNSNKVKSTCRARAPTCRRQRSRVCSWWCTRCACHKAQLYTASAPTIDGAYTRRSCACSRATARLMCCCSASSGSRGRGRLVYGVGMYIHRSHRVDRERRHWTAWFCHARAPRRLTNWRLRLPDRGPLACNSHATPLWRTGAFTSSAAAQLQTSHSHPAVSQGLLATRHTLD